ncbi:MAG: DUF2796 domain-containing protein [Pseudomonadota bacterium]
MRLNFPTVLAASSFALVGLVACSPSEDAPAETLEADTPPVEAVSEEVSVPEVAEAEAAVTAEAMTEAEHDHDHEGEDGHDHGDDHDHGDEHDHDGEHSHDEDHDHDHDGHDHGVGEAHVHGTGEMAIALDGAALSVSFEAPLASFASFEHEPKTPEQEAELQAVRDAFTQVSAVIALNGEAGCTSTSQDIAFRHSGDHGSIMADYMFDCATADGLASAELALFETYPALETVNTVFLNGADQTAKTLSSGDRTLSLE